ncbi:cyclin N-terminal domain-containing protein [Favolaschia claudopus]|uniref:Cyclin N-terminal domain-containing protein n=1 Tax=Favolaschia claudopus TaxID=2862362 RepID=A0AAW0AGG5_9AGAR
MPAGMSEFSTSSSPVHPASLVDPSSHSPELMQLVDMDVSPRVIDYISTTVIETVNHALSRPPTFRSTHTPKFPHFVANVLSRAEVTPATILVTLSYIVRSKRHLSIALEEWALERVFLGALIVASKYTQDSTLRNVHWALVTGVFGKGDIGRIEREFLDVLDWELNVSEADLLAHHELLMISSSSSRTRVTPPSHLVSVPELEPCSSPHSSANSLSPRTPISNDVSPIDVDDIVSPTATLVDEPHAVSISPPSKKRGRPIERQHRRIRDFVRAFPHTTSRFAVEVAA